MKPLPLLLLFCVVLSPAAHARNHRGDPANTVPAERLGTVRFPNSCSQSAEASFDRGVALLHDFWYEEARRQFEQIAKTDPGCAMAHWGIAMSVFHQIWNRPSEDDMTLGWKEIEQAQSAAAKTDREREYIAALGAFYRPGQDKYETRIDAYSTAMSKLYRDYPDDTDAGAFYALSLLADEPPDDTSLNHQRQGLAVLTPLFAKYPDHPGVAHYIIHACDNPLLASQGLEAAKRYGEIAPSAAHAAHMPSHVFARLGMWREDIDSNLASVAASQKALENHPSSIFDQLHADDFLLYAYLQSGRDASAKGIVENSVAVIAKSESTRQMSGMSMSYMLPFYRTKFPIFYDLEMRDWQSAGALEPVAGALPEIQMFTYWARIMAAGHLHRAQAARADLAKYDALVDQVKRGKHSYEAESTGARVERDEVLAWAAFAQGDQEPALNHMRAAADLQDKVGQAEVDIPAREMLADMLLEFHQPEKALVEYDLALRASPNRFNALFNAGRAAEAAGEKAKAAQYYSVLLKTTDNGVQSSRPEFAHVKSFLSTAQLARR